MDKFESLSHTAWDCKYHVIFIAKCRRRTLYRELGQHLGEVFRKLASQKESRIEEGHLMPDHVHMMLAIPSTRCRSGGFHQGQGFNLTTLAPDIVDAILLNELPDHLTLFDLASDTPLSWNAQRGLLNLPAGQVRPGNDSLASKLVN